MIRDLQLRRLADRTQQSYVQAVAGLAQYYKQSPDRIDDQKVQDYLLHLLNDRHLSWSTCDLYAAGISFFYRVTLKRPASHFILPPRRHRDTPWPSRASSSASGDRKSGSFCAKPRSPSDGGSSGNADVSRSSVLASEGVAGIADGSNGIFLGRGSWQPPLLSLMRRLEDSHRKLNGELLRISAGKYYPINCDIWSRDLARYRTIATRIGSAARMNQMVLSFRQFVRNRSFNNTNNANANQIQHILYPAGKTDAAHNRTPPSIRKKAERNQEAFWISRKVKYSSGHHTVNRKL